MERILLLNNDYFPHSFNSISITPPTGITKDKYVELKIIESINQYNKKLNVSSVEYLAIETQFSFYKRGVSNGVLVEEFEINPLEKNRYIQNGCYVYNIASKYFCRRILLYLFISRTEEDTRTAFISQTVFPTLLDYVEDYLISPSYTIANHKFCFINILNKKLTAKMILRHLASLYLAGMDYVEVFENSLNCSSISTDMEEFLRTYSSDFENSFNNVTKVYDDDNYIVDIANKKFIWKTSSLISNLLSKGTYVDFNGSKEKFYWIEVFPMSIFAYNQGYKVDYSEYKEFISTYKSKFSIRSDKFHRCETLLKYLDKYFI